MKKIIMTISRPPGISKHNVVGYLIDSESKEEFDRLMKPDDDGLPKYVFGVVIKDNDIEYNEYGEFAKYTIEALTTWYDGVKYKFITKSDLYKVFPLDLDGDLLSLQEPEPEKIFSDEYCYHYYSPSYCDEGIYYVRNKHLRDMKENIFNRTKFSEQFSRYIGDDKTLERIEDVLSGDHIVGDFRIWQEEEEVYILHLPSGTIVGWYKFYHYGRCNFCNKPDMSIEDLADFFSLLRNQLLEEADEPDESRPLTVTAKETVDESKVDNSTPDVWSMYPNVTEPPMESEAVRSLFTLRKFYKEEQLRLKTLMNSMYGAASNNDEENEE